MSIKPLTWFSCWFIIKLNIHEAKIHLSHYLNHIVKGETIILCKRNIPVAKIKPFPKENKSNRPIGLAKGTFTVPGKFNDPLPEDVMNNF